MGYNDSQDMKKIKGEIIMTTEEMLLQLIEGQKQTNERLDKIDDDLSELKEYAEITRGAANTLIEKFEDLVTVLNETNTITFKV